MELDRAALLRIGEETLSSLQERAAALRDEGFGSVVTYSRKVFIPLTQLCRDVCHYCTFAQSPRRIDRAYLGLDEVLSIARAGAAQGCNEALFTLGDKPEMRYPAARKALAAMGHDRTLDYVRQAAAMVLRDTGLLPHINAGVMSEDDYASLRPVAPSMGLMLESASDRLCERGQPHFGSPDKAPLVRLESIAAAGRAGVPMTTGLLIGIGETREERIDSLLALRALHHRYGHLQELIIQNFMPKPGTAMALMPPAPLDELLWTIAMARLTFGAAMSIQTPPNLNVGRLEPLIAAGVNDWGGVSPVTPDHVNPEAPWPLLRQLATETDACGKTLTQRLTIYPAYLRDARRWIDPTLLGCVLAVSDADGYARDDRWKPGAAEIDPAVPERPSSPSRHSLRWLEDSLQRSGQGERLGEEQIEALFRARGPAFHRIVEAADESRRSASGDVVTYVVNRNINYTNICSYKCTFCAFSKGRGHDDLRGAPYMVSLDEIARRTREAWDRGATEVCMQGGIHPAFDGNTYLEICRAAKRAVPQMHIHAFSALEVFHGARTLGIEVRTFLQHLIDAGLSTLPGTAAEILDDSVRARICPDKVTTQQWLDVIATAHELGLRTTATMMFGHVEGVSSWARHLLHLRDLQQRTGGFTEFVPLPFVSMEAPMARRGQARSGPTFREVMLVHAVARLVLYPYITNIQASWPKLGPRGVRLCLDAGVNDLGGTLMNESISRAAGAGFGEEMPPVALEALIRAAGRVPRQRTTGYGATQVERRTSSFAAAALTPSLFRDPREYKLKRLAQ